MSSKFVIGKGADSVLISIYLTLLFLGWITLYSTTGQSDWKGLINFSFASSFGKQSLWIVISIILFIFIQYLPKRIWGSLSWLFYIGSIVLLILVLVFGSDVKGAQSWLRIGSFSIQPSEFAKLGLFLVLSSFLSNISVNVKSILNRIVANSLIIIPLIFVLLQPDAGSGIVFLSCFLVLYREGYSPFMLMLSVVFVVLFITTLMFNVGMVILYLIFVLNCYWLFNIKKNKNYLVIYLVLGFCSSIGAYYGFTNYLIISHLLVTVLVAIYLIFLQKDHAFVIASGIFAMVFSFFCYSIEYLFDNFLKPHQQARIYVWIDPSKGDPKGSLYNLLQSKMAIGSGSLFGKGFLNGNMTKLNYIPEQNTDFIFSGIAEQFGFIGSFTLILLFIGLLLRLIYLAERQKSPFSRIFLLCVSCCIFTHFFINIGMTMGLVPVIGIPLPFISYGGTALLSFTAMLAIACALDDTKDGSSNIVL